MEAIRNPYKKEIQTELDTAPELIILIILIRIPTEPQNIVGGFLSILSFLSFLFSVLS